MYYECVSGEDNLCDITSLGSHIVQCRDDINMAALLAVTTIMSLTWCGLGRNGTDHVENVIMNG